jgi:hypothetical protein
MTTAVPDLQPILSIRATVAPEDVAAFTHRSLERIRLHIERHGIETAGGPFVTTHTYGESCLVDVEAAWPTRHLSCGSTDIHAGVLPRATRG